jgi:hypothetical protein
MHMHRAVQFCGLATNRTVESRLKGNRRIVQGKVVKFPQARACFVLA